MTPDELKEEISIEHVVYHGYGFQLEWNRMKEGMENIDDVFSIFNAKLLDFLQTL